jgi:hypothetical protein
MASSAPRIVEEGVADARPLPATKSGSAALSLLPGMSDVSLAMWMICAQRRVLTRFKARNICSLRERLMTCLAP